jgi:hypothetical protein
MRILNVRGAKVIIGSTAVVIAVFSNYLHRLTQPLWV